MRNFKSFLFATAMSFALAAPALAAGTSFSGTSNAGFSNALNGTTASGSESFGSVGSGNGAGGFAAATGSSYELGGDFTAVSPNSTVSVNGATSGFSTSGYASPNATFSSTGDAFTQNTTNFSDSNYANVNGKVHDTGFAE